MLKICGMYTNHCYFVTTTLYVMLQIGGMYTNHLFCYNHTVRYASDRWYVY